MFKIFYADKSIITSNDMDWHKAPAYGVIAIREDKMIHMGVDYYLMKNGTIINFSIKDLHQHLLDGLLPGAIKFGQWINDKDYNEIIEMASK